MNLKAQNRLILVGIIATILLSVPLILFGITLEILKFMALWKWLFN